MRISESSDCVAYYFKLNRPRIVGPMLDHKYSFDYVKSYTLHLIDKAKITRKQQSIKNEVMESTSFSELIYIVDRVITNGDRTEFKDYDKKYH